VDLTKHYSGDQVPKNEIGEAGSTCGEENGVLVGKPEGKKSLVRSRRRWKDNMKMHLQEVGYGDMDWIDLG